MFGPLPEVALSSLRKLQILDLGQNMLTGTVPPELGLLANLEGSCDRVASLQLFLVQHTCVKAKVNLSLRVASTPGLYLFSNHLTGHLPSQLGNLILLQELELQSNQLSGRLPPVRSHAPAWFGNLPHPHYCSFFVC